MYLTPPPFFFFTPDRSGNLRVANIISDFNNINLFSVKGAISQFYTRIIFALKCKQWLLLYSNQKYYFEKNNYTKIIINFFLIYLIF